MALTPAQQHDRAVGFVEQWRGHGRERQEAQRFWLQLATEVLGVDDPFGFDTFQAEHPDAKGGYSDIMLPRLNLLVEQKGLTVDLDRPEPRQGRQVTPLQQALDYNNGFPFSERQRIICTCNFREFRFYDLDKDPLAKNEPYARFTLEELPDNLHVFRALMQAEDTPDAPVSENRRVDVDAARHVATLNRHLSRFYHHADTDPTEHRALALTTVRLVFLYYAEDSGLLGSGQFTDYVETLTPDLLGTGLQTLFHWVDTPPERREHEYPSRTLAAFPYIDGGLFHETIPIPPVDEDFRRALLDMGRRFDWSAISPVIFGSLMEETLSHDERRQGGMHYTSPTNIRKVIDPLFLDDLKTELKNLTDQYDDRNVSPQKRVALIRRLHDFQDRLAGLNFLDPACGSGNFLTETFLQLRALEDQILVRLQNGMTMLDLGDEYLPVKVSIRQFHGIEINDFACSVARTSLWIAGQQALDRTEALCGGSYDSLPLTDSGDIIQANALQADWNRLLPADQCDYIMGNPPFIGHQQRTPQIRNDMETVCGREGGSLDYVAGWYYKALDYLDDNPNARIAFVSTNSITQGQQVAPLYGHIRSKGWWIRFAHRTFRWDAQSTDNAHVHVVILGLDHDGADAARRLYSYPDIDGEPVETTPNNINGYLVDAPDVTVTPRGQKKGPLSPMLNLASFGSMPLDGGNLLIDDEQAYHEAMDDPIASRFVRPFRMGKEMINSIDRWCLWLVDAEPGDIRRSRFLRNRVDACREYRENAPVTGDAYKNRNTPWLFRDDHQPRTRYLAIPAYFSGRREYTTCDWYPPDVIAGNKIYTCDDPDGFNFAIIESAMFMAWQKTIGGRLKSDPGFSNTVVWNTLPLPKLDDETRQQVIDMGKEVLSARRNHPGQSLADLYDPMVMPRDLRRAHGRLDEIVDRAFGAEQPCSTVEERQRVLFTGYVRMIGG